MKDCNSCGKCCIKYGNGGLSASSAEIEYWDIHRPDIFRYVSDEKIWMNPDSSELLERCPFLRKDDTSNKYLCDIYEDRPDDCRFYPATVEEMIRDGCEMIDAEDLVYPARAQRKLDKIMQDSRSPRE